MTPLQAGFVAPLLTLFTVLQQGACPLEPLLDGVLDGTGSRTTAKERV